MSLLQPGHFQSGHFPVNHWQTYNQHFPHFFWKSGPLFQDFEEIAKPITIVHKGQIVLELTASSKIDWQSLPIKKIITLPDEIIIEVEDGWELLLDSDLWLSLQ